MRVPFRKDPEGALSAEIGPARDHRDRLAVRVADAEQQYTDAKARVQQLLATDAPNAALEKAEAAVASSESAIEQRKIALEAAQAKLDGLELQHAELLDAKQRAETLTAIDRDVARLTSIHAEFAASCEAYHDICRKIAAYTPEATELTRFLQRAPSELATTLEIIARGAAGFGSLIKGRAVPPRLPLPEEPASTVVALPTPAPEIEIVPSRHLSWTDGQGALRLLPLGHRARLPQAVAEHALSLRVAHRYGTPEAKRLLEGQFSTQIPSLKSCVSLDREAAKAKEAAEPAGFERLDRGPAFTMSVAAG